MIADGTAAAGQFYTEAVVVVVDVGIWVDARFCRWVVSCITAAHKLIELGSQGKVLLVQFHHIVAGQQIGEEVVAAICSHCALQGGQCPIRLVAVEVQRDPVDAVVFACIKDPVVAEVVEDEVSQAQLRHKACVQRRVVFTCRQRHRQGPPGHRVGIAVCCIVAPAVGGRRGVAGRRRKTYRVAAGWQGIEAIGAFSICGCRRQRCPFGAVERCDHTLERGLPFLLHSVCVQVHPDIVAQARRLHRQVEP